jgi:hypothetical protein
MNKNIVTGAIIALAVSAAYSQHQFSKDRPEVGHATLVAAAKSTCAPFEGRKLSLVIPFKAGGGFDLMGRALEPVLEKYSGMSVSVSNISGGNGMMAIRSVLNAKSDRPVVGLIDLGTFATETVNAQAENSLSALVGLGLMSTDHSVWVTRQTFNLSESKNHILTVAAAASPYVRLGIPGQLLGLNLKPIFGFEGANQTWLALLRGDIDITTMSDQSAKRNFATVSNAKVSLTMTNHEHPDFPGTPYLAGAGGLVDLRTKGMPQAERKRLMDLASLAVMLSEQAKVLVVSSKLQSSLLTCLRHASEAALFDSGLAETAQRQKLSLKPEAGQSVQERMKQVDQALKVNSKSLRDIGSRWKNGS